MPFPASLGFSLRFRSQERITLNAWQWQIATYVNATTWTCRATAAMTRLSSSAATSSDRFPPIADLDARAVMWMRHSAIKNNRWMRIRQGGMWLDLVALTLGALLLGAAIIANFTDGPMREPRPWVAHVSK